MAFGPNAKIKFKQSAAADVVANRVRIQPANSTPDKATPFDEVPKPTPDADGFSYIAFADLPKTLGLDGTFDIDVTAVDDAGAESAALQINSVVFDFEPPTAPTDGEIVEG